MTERDRLAALIDECYQRGLDAPEAADFILAAAERPDADPLREALNEAAAGLEDAREWLASRAVAPEVQERIEAAQHLAAMALRRAADPTCSDCGKVAVVDADTGVCRECYDRLKS